MKCSKCNFDNPNGKVKRMTLENFAKSLYREIQHELSEGKCKEGVQ